MAAEHTSAHESVGVPPPDHGGGSGPLSPDAQMLIWTWVTFGIVAALLYKIAWKPILAGLEARELRIRSSLEQADEVRKSLAALEVTGREMRAEAERHCREMIARAQEAAKVAADQVEKTAHERVRVLYENAERDIAAMRNRVVADIRREQADMICTVAGRLIASKLGVEQNRALVDKLLSEF